MIDTPVVAPSPPTPEQIETWLQNERERSKGGADAFYKGQGSTAPVGHSDSQKSEGILRSSMRLIRRRLSPRQ